MLLKIVHHLSLPLALIFGLLSCTSRIEERIPDERTVRFPNSMALEGDVLVVNATNADGKYNYGRLITLDAKAIKTLTGADAKSLPWSKVVTSDALAPLDVGAVVMTKGAITFTDRRHGKLFSVPIEKLLASKDPFVEVQKISGAESLSFFEDGPEQDINGLTIIKTGDDEDIFLASSLSSDALELVRLTKNPQLSLKKVKHLSGLDLLKLKIDAKDLEKHVRKYKKDQKPRVITKAMFATSIGDEASKVYLLLELHRQKNLFAKSPRALFLVSIKVSDLLADAPITKVDVLDLKKSFNIHGGRDLFIDETAGLALVLATNPSGLFKIDLKNKSILETASTCSDAAGIAVNKDLDLVVIPCSKEDRLMSFFWSDMGIKATSDVVGRAPAYALIDKERKLIYCSYYHDGRVAIFDENLKYLGHLFDKAQGEGLRP